MKLKLSNREKILLVIAITCLVGELYTKVRELEPQFEVNVETAIIKAAIFVTKNPQH